MHIPSGQMIQMSGNFEVAKKINTVACIVLIVILMCGLLGGNMYIIVAAMLTAAVVLAVSEIYITERKIIERNWTVFLKRIVPAIIIVLVTSLIGMSNVLKCNDYLDFFIMSMVSVVVLSVVTFVVYYFVDKVCMRQIFNFIKYNVIRG